MGMNKVSLKVEVQSKASEYSLQYCIGKYLEEAGFDNVVVEPLKVQEPARPIIKQEMDDICSCIDNVAYCGRCGARIGRLKQNYCPNCGKAVKWE